LLFVRLLILLLVFNYLFYASTTMYLFYILKYFLASFIICDKYTKILITIVNIYFHILEFIPFKIIVLFIVLFGITFIIWHIFLWNIFYLSLSIHPSIRPSVRPSIFIYPFFSNKKEILYFVLFTNNVPSEYLINANNKNAFNKFVSFFNT